MGREAIPLSVSSSVVNSIKRGSILRRKKMKKINEDWLATILGFVVIILAILHVIDPAWVKF